MRFYRRRSGLTAACGLLALGGLASAAAPVCHADEAVGKTVSIDVAAGDLHAVVSMLERQVNVEASVRDGDKPYKPVYVHLDGASLPKALRTIARSAGAKVSKNEDGVYVFEPESALPTGSGDSPADAAAPAPAVQSSAASSLPVDNRPESRYPPGSLHWQTIVLQHAVPSDILKLMHWDQDLVELPPFKPLEAPIRRPEVSALGSPTSLPSNLLGYGSSAYPNNGYSNNAGSGYGNYQNGSDPSVPLGTGNGGPTGANYSNSAHRSAEPGSPNQANQFPGGFGGGGFGGGGQFGGGGGQFGGGQFGGGQLGGGNPFGGGGNPFGGGGNPFGGGGNPFGGGQVGGGQRGGFGQQQAALPDGVTRIFALQSNNSLLVQATVEGYQTVKNLVRILDIAPRQVQIKVEFVTASVADVDNLGVNFDLVPYPGLEFATTQGSSAISNAAQPTFLQYATGNIVAQLFQTLVRTRGKVVQAPLITTTNNVQATIQISTQIPFFTTTAVPNGGLAGGTTTFQSPQFLPIVTFLTITPRINSDDSVTMNLAPQIQDTTGQSVGGIPATVSQSVTTLRTIRSGDTMVLGGLVRKQETTSSQRIPILSDIPFLGGIFRTRNKQVNDSELLIFVTPTIIGESNDSDTANANGGQSVTITP